ncbi:MAG TPA: ABC transporter permease [Bryobacteraceae bacterium]|nr:ABC transporter permease [Bryobacteraceae bacterium]
MIAVIVRTGFKALRRDRGAFLLSFILPIAFFSIFATIMGGMGSSGTARVSVLVVDEDRTAVSERLVRGLRREPSLAATTAPEAKKGQPAPPEYTAATAEAAVKQGVAPAALIIPQGFGANPVAFGPQTGRQPIRILHDSSDPVAAQVVAGLLQKVVMTSLPDTMAGVGMKYFDQASGGLTAEQRKDIESNLSKFHDQMEQRDQEGSAPAADSANNAGGLVAVDIRDVVGENKRSPMVAFSAAGIGVMFLLFTASASAGSLLSEAECGALDRILSARVSMTTLLAGKMTYCTLLAFLQLTLMFLWGAAVFHLELFTHLPGFLLMTAATSFAVASFGMLLATVSRSRGQQAAISTLLILSMSAIGGSMVPRFLMPEAMKTAGLFTFNAWAIDGYTKVFWRDEPISHLAPQLAVLIGSGMVLFLIARRFARKWEYQ